MDEQAAKLSAGLSVIFAAFALGVAGFAAVAYLVGPVAELDADTAGMLRYIVLGLTVVTAIQVTVLYQTQGTRMAALTAPTERLAAYRGRAIIIAASAEGVALFAGVAMILTGASWHVAPAFALFFGVLGWIWPTPGRVEMAMGDEKTARGKYD